MRWQLQVFPYSRVHFFAPSVLVRAYSLPLLEHIYTASLPITGVDCVTPSQSTFHFSVMPGAAWMANNFLLAEKYTVPSLSIAGQLNLAVAPRSNLPNGSEE